MKNFKQIFSLMAFLLMPFTIMAQEDITDQYLQNADLSSLGGGWDYGDDGYSYTDWNTGADVPVVEFYHTWSTNPGADIGYARNFHFTQTITLPAGDYRIAVSAFYREGNGNGTNTKAYIFAGDKQQYVYGLSSHEQADVAGTSGKYVGGSDLLRAANAFSKGDFSNAFDFSLPTEQEITLGFRGYIDTYCSWCILGPVKLYKYSLENYLEDYGTKVAEANALTGKMGAAEAQALSDALVPENSFSLSSEVVQAIETLTNAINAAKQSIDDYAALADALANAAAIIRNTEGDADGDLLATYNNAVSSIQNAYDAGTVADLAGTIAALEEAVKPLVKYQKADNSDYTMAIVNPHINGSDGWTCERPYGGNGPLLRNEQFEYWAGNAYSREDGSFDYHQEISGLPNGYYKVSASMFNSLNDEGGSYTEFAPTSGLYATSGSQEVNALVEEDSWELKAYTTDEILVTNGKIRIGVKNVVTPMAARWFVADDFHLTLVRYVEGEEYGSCPDGNHPHMIDLGLPSGTKWACCNVGTTSPEGYGGYYAWGETEEKDSYNWENYIHCDGSSSTCHDIGTNITGTDYDVAHVKWGGSWQMPSWEQFDELLQNCNSEWTTVNGTYGRKFTSSNNGNSIFFPAAGANGGSHDVGSWDLYWTSSPRDENGAYGFGSSSGGVSMYNGFRLEGLSVRPVTTCEALEYQDGDIFTAQAVEGVEMTFKVISAASKTCQVGDGNNAAIDPSITSPLTIPSIVNGYSVTSIGAWALDGNSSESITIPNSVTSIGWGAFANCNNITSITIPDGVTSIAGVFQCCENLTSVDIQNGLTSIGGLAFHSCYNLTTVNIPNSVTTIESVAFSYCTGLTSITIPNSVSNIESNVIWGCSGLTSIISEITEPSAINKEAFALGDGEGWTTATLYVPAGTKALYEAAAGWNKFQNIVEMEGDEPHGGTDIAIDATNFPDENFRNWLLNQDYGQDGVLTQEEIAEVTNIDVNNKEIQSLKGIEIFTALRVLHCYNNQLTSLDVSNNTALTGLRCEGNQLTSLDVAHNTALTGLNCSLNNIDEAAMDALVASLPYMKGGVIFVKNSESSGEGNVCTPAQVGIANAKGWTVYDGLDVMEGETPETVLNYAFDDDDLTASVIALADGRKYEGDIVIPESVQHNGQTYSVTGIGDWAFYGCYTLTSINIPNSVTAIGWGAFASCGIASVTIPSGITSIAGVFQCCSNLTTANIQSDLTVMGDLAFHSCDNLITVNIPNSVECIDSQAFSYCSSLTSITIPGRVSAIRANAFLGCSGLTSVISEITEPSAIDEKAFKVSEDEGWTTATLYVPAGTKALYEATAGWNKFQNIVEMEGDEPTEVIPDEAIDLGLPSGTKWAPWNIGASKPEESGGYYAWGETEEKEVYDWSTYIHCDGALGTCHNIGTNIAGSEYDVAHVKWGGSWTMPTFDQVKELLDNCTSEWTTVNGINGRRFTGSNGNSIFIPAVGYHCDSYLYNVDSDGYYWSSSLHELYSDCAHNLYFYSGNAGWNYYERYYGQSVRPVINGEPSTTDIAIDATNFPDEDFRNWLLSQDYGQDGVLTQEEIAGVTEISIESENLQSLKGIEFFTALTGLYCGFNQLTSLDVSHNTALTVLYCNWNQVTSLDVSNNTALIVLDCGGNQLTSLTVSKNTALTKLSCACNQLTSLDVSKNTALTELFCYSNQLTSLDLSKNAALTGLYCSQNSIDEAAMDVLVNSLPHVQNGRLEVKEPADGGEGNVITPAQVAVANSKGWTVYQLDGVSGDWVEMEPVDVQPLHNDEVVTFDEENGIDEETDLSGNVIGNIFYNINTGDGGYNAAEGCITVTKPVSDEQVASLEGQDIFGEDFKSQFTGIVFKVPAGSGTVKVTAETTGNTTLKVKIGSGAPIEMELDGKLKASFPYNVATPSYVYIYAGQAGATVKGYGVPANGGGGELKIYGIQVNNDTPVGIADVQHEPSSTTIYNLSGQRLARPQRGLNIVNGKKVAIK